MPEAWSARLATPAKILPLCRPRFRQWKPALHHTSKKQQGCQKGDLPTPPSTPRQSPPKIERPQIQIRSDVDPKGKKRTIEEIKVHKPFVYSWQPKKRPWSCHSNYSRHSRSLREQRRNSSDCAGRMFENDGKGRPRCSRNSEVNRRCNGGGKGCTKSVREAGIRRLVERKSEVYEGPWLDVPPIQAEVENFRQWLAGFNQYYEAGENWGKLEDLNCNFLSDLMDFW